MAGLVAFIVNNSEGVMMTFVGIKGETFKNKNFTGHSRFYFGFLQQ
jgi:hypothetical protein